MELVRYRYPPPTKTVRQGLNHLTLSLCAACGLFAAREVEPRRYKCYRCKAVIEYIIRGQEQSPDGSHSD